MNTQYSVQIIWSDEDGHYLAQVPELPGCVSDGKTPQEAIENLWVILREWLDIAKEDQTPIPPPMTLERLEIEGLKTQQQLQQLVQVAVLQALDKQKKERQVSPLPGWRFDPSENPLFAGKGR